MKEGLLALFVLGLLLTSCQTTPVQTEGTSNTFMEIAPQTLQTDIGPIKVLKQEQNRLMLSKSELPDTFFFNEKYIDTDKKKKIQIGDGDYGKSFVMFRKHALKNPQLMQFGYAADSTIRCWVGGPGLEDGTRLNRKFKLRISYKSAEMNGINENDLRIFRYDPKQELWILVGGQGQKKKDYMTVNTRYTGYYIVADCQGNTIGHEDRIIGTGAELSDQNLHAIEIDNSAFENEFISTFDYITYHDGGKLKIDYKADDESKLECKAELKIDKKSINIDSELEMNLDRNALIGNVDVTFHPHGTTFDIPAELTVEVKNIDLSHWELDKLGLYYDNPETGEWEKMAVKEVKIDVEKGYVKIIEAKLPHFSRYAMAYGW